MEKANFVNYWFSPPKNTTMSLNPWRFMGFRVLARPGSGGYAPPKLHRPTDTWGTVGFSHIAAAMLLVREAVWILGGVA